MRELVTQMAELGQLGNEPSLASNVLKLEEAIAAKSRDGSLDSSCFGVPLAASLIPWIDKPVSALIQNLMWALKAPTFIRKNLMEPWDR